MHFKMSYLFLISCFLILPSVSFAVDIRSAIITKVDGEVGVRIDNSDWKPATAGTVLHANDEIRTGTKSTAKILLDKDGVSGQLDLDPQSRLRLGTLEGDLNAGTQATILDLAIGNVLVHAAKQTENSRFLVRTPNSTTGVRGTTFSVSAEPKK